jgi:hypothetical protein
LGLVIAYRIIKAHEGDMNFVEVERFNNSISIQLPL